MENERDFMRQNGKKKEGQRNVLPPQIFNGEKYCGDYDDFDVANEDDELEEFLGIPRKTPKFDPVKTGAVAPEVGKLEPGKLKNGAKLTKPEATEPTFNTEPSEQDHETSNETESNSCKDDHEDFNEDEENEDEGNKEENDEDEEEVDDDDNTKIIEEAHHHEVYTKHNLTIENVALPIMTSKIDNGFDAQVQVEGIERRRPNTEEDQKPELNLKLDIPDVPFEEFVIPETPKRYMDDGVEIRELRPGFQELGNCKRFWKAQQLIGTP
ncbi:SH3 domain-binding glutamic acid-rich protein isoform X2 [Eurytemora carolleeae]|nr:SH3 domain-binding glutamic acid-rich protein isoform X2 [Eurytemora carolleeae]|eukprot:XP_023327859.1 SH3 domain-binding glutamic acid-rich protein-like isoform X2 [Eurytemora affinis]